MPSRRRRKTEVVPQGTGARLEADHHPQGETQAGQKKEDNWARGSQAHYTWGSTRPRIRTPLVPPNALVFVRTRFTRATLALFTT